MLRLLIVDFFKIFYIFFNFQGQNSGGGTDSNQKAGSTLMTVSRGAQSLPPGGGHPLGKNLGCDLHCRKPTMGIRKEN